MPIKLPFLSIGAGRAFRVAFKQAIEVREMVETAAQADLANGKLGGAQQLAGF